MFGDTPREARAYLRALGIPTEGLTDEQATQAAQAAENTLLGQQLKAAVAWAHFKAAIMRTPTWRKLRRLLRRLDGRGQG